MEGVLQNDGIWPYLSKHDVWVVIKLSKQTHHHVLEHLHLSSWSKHSTYHEVLAYCTFNSFLTKNCLYRVLDNNKGFCSYIQKFIVAQRFPSKNKTLLGLCLSYDTLEEVFLILYELHPGVQLGKKIIKYLIKLKYNRVLTQLCKEGDIQVDIRSIDLCLRYKNWDIFDCLLSYLDISWDELMVHKCLPNFHTYRGQYGKQIIESTYLHNTLPMYEGYNKNQAISAPYFLEGLKNTMGYVFRVS